MTTITTSRGIPLRWSGTRWLLLGLFPVLYIVADRTIGPLPPRFAVLTLMNALACTLLLTRLSRTGVRTLWAWVGLIVFMDGDFLKMIILARKLNSPGYLAARYPELRWLSEQTLIHGYAWMTLGFVTYCVVATAVLAWAVQPTVPPETDRPPVRLRTATTLNLAAAVFLLYLLATLLQVRSGYGVLGSGNQGLTGPIGTLLTLFRRYVAPALLVLFLWVFDRTKPMLARWVTLAILAAGLLDAFATTSRGSLVAFMTPVFFLFILTRRLTPPRRALIAATAVAVLVLFPIVSAIRFHTSAAHAGGGPVPSVRELIDSGTVVLARMQGAEGVWYGQSFRHTGVSLSRTARFLRPQAMRNYYTHSVVGVTRPNDFRAPGLIGAFMVIGGGGGVIVLMTGFVLLLERSWSYFARRLETWPVALALTAASVLGFMGEGTLLMGELVKLAMVIVTCELVYTRLLRRVMPEKRGTPVELSPSVR